MDETGICGRNKEVKGIQEFISQKISARQSGILYLTGPPGTGKSMCVRYILDQLKDVPNLNINCLKAQSSKVILSKICDSVGLEKFTRFNESEITERLRKKFTGRTSSAHLIVLDEMDQLPKSRNIDLIKTIFSWPNQAHSKLILIGIANTVSLTSRYQTICSFIGKDDQHITKIIFRPYTIKDVKDILNWYLDNDENYEDGSLEPRVIDMIAAKCARVSGDIRSALNSLRSAIDDTLSDKKQKQQLSELPELLTPPATPPPNPCQEKTNLTSFMNSVKKRQKTTHYQDDKFPFPHQVILTCIYKLCSESVNRAVDLQICKNLVIRVMRKFQCTTSNVDFKAMLDNLELQGNIGLRKGRPRDKVILKLTENEFTDLVQRKDMIIDIIKSIS